MKQDQRKYRRTTIYAFIRFYEGTIHIPAHDYRQGVIRNYSAGGLGIATARPLPKGTVVTVEIPIEKETREMKIIQVSGVVRWVHGIPGRQTMGIEFFKLKDSEYQDFEEWMTHLIG